MILRCTLFFVLAFAGATALLAQNSLSSLVQSGPMVGYAQMREVALWVQTKQAARVKFVYYETTNASVRRETDEIQTSPENAFTAKALATSLEPGRKYSYELHLNGKKVAFPYPLEFQTLKLWQWRGDPPTFSIAVGSCAYINEADYERPNNFYGSNYQIFNAIHAKRPDAMLWLGDNVYMREVDWGARSSMIKRYTHSRSVPELQPLLASTHHYAIWDDHDYGPNDSDRGFTGKYNAYDVFKMFWANPHFGVMGKPGCTMQFEWGDVEFFCLDNRFYRSPNNRKIGKREMLSDWQIEWLIDALTTSRATFKIVAVGGQVLNPLAVYENYATFPEERQKLLDLIQQEGVKGVIFLSGDRHHTEMNKLEREGAYPIHEFTISPLTAGVNPKAVDEPNPLRVPGTFAGEHNFAVFEFSGAFRDRTLKCTVYNVNGKELWTQSINSKDIR
jgi:alkaline phosphatase D